jgi:ABC-type oligopeptide transport system substrate-binding subunit
MLRVQILAFLVLLPFAALGAEKPMHGIAMYGEPKQPADFRHFSYVNPQAPKGGRLSLGSY